MFIMKKLSLFIHFMTIVLEFVILFIIVNLTFK